MIDQEDPGHFAPTGSTTITPSVIGDLPGPPGNAEIEQGLLGAILADNDAYIIAADIVGPDHFFYGLHGRIFGACGELIKAGTPVNAVRLSVAFAADADAEAAGGKQYFASLQANFVSILNAKSYAESIVDLSVRRQIMGACMETFSASALDLFDHTGAALAEDLSGEIQKITSAAEPEGSGPQHIGDLAWEALDGIARARAAPGTVSGTSTGFLDLDDLLGGLEPGSLTVLAARPSMGKSALACCICYRLARGTDLATETGTSLFFSLEMGKADVARRLLSGISNSTVSAMRKGAISDAQMADIEAAREALGGLPIYVDDGTSLTVAQMSLRARRLKREKGLDLLVIDHLGFVRPPNPRSNNKVADTGDITRECKALAKDLDVPVILLSQLSRALEARDDKRPVLSDLRNSGDIEQDADNVIFIYRDAYYLARETARAAGGRPLSLDEEAARQQRLEDSRNRAEIIVAKQRHGAVRTVTLFFDEATTTFDNWSGPR